MTTCTIQWIDARGKPTADNNPAIGRVRTRERFEQRGGLALHYKQSAWFPICACHARRLHDAGMHIWEFEAIDPQA
jgi:hypothetical protein